MEMLITLIGRFIRIFHPKVALLFTLIFAFAPILIAIAICWYFNFTGAAFWTVAVVSCVLEFIWGLKFSAWWDDQYPKCRHF